MEIKEYKVKSKSFYSGRFWYYKNGEKKSKYKKGFETQKEAKNWGTDEERRLKGLRVGSDKLKVKDFLEKWIKTKTNKLSPTTLSGYNVNIRHINRFIGEARLLDLNLIDIQEMIDDLSEEGLKYRTVLYIYRTLHAALGYAVLSKAIPENVSNGIEIKEDEEKFEVSIYSAEDLNSLLFSLREQQHEIYPAVMLASLRGLRRGETLGLRWSDIDFDKGIAHIKNNYVRANKEYYNRKVKTKESDRQIDISGFVEEELKLIKERNKKLYNSIQIYVCQIDDKQPDPSHVSKKLHQFQETNNLPLCRFHDLRHTFAMLQIEYGTDLDTLKRLLGHSKIGITSDTYLHKSTTLMKKASAKMENVININKAQKSENSKMSQ